MENLKEILVYIFRAYPNAAELSKARLVKIVYLSDWKSCITYGEQISSIKWFFNHYGPYVEDVMDIIKKDSSFSVKLKSSNNGYPRECIDLIDLNYTPYLSNKSKSVIDFVISKTYPLQWNDFISLVYSTYPIVNQPKYTFLDLELLAHDYMRLKNQKKELV